MDYMNLTIGGVAVAGLILAIVEALKGFGINGKGSQVAAFIAGFLLVGASVAIEEGMIAAYLVPYIELVVKALAGALSAMGLYDLIVKRILKVPGRD